MVFPCQGKERLEPAVVSLSECTSQEKLPNVLLMTTFHPDFPKQFPFFIHLPS